MVVMDMSDYRFFPLLHAELLLLPYSDIK